MLGFLYSCVIVITLVGYMPQIARLIATKTDCADISISTWSMWKVASLISLAYGHYELSDLKFCATAGINAVCIATIISITLWKRNQFKNAQLT